MTTGDSMLDGLLKGRRALVTGGSRGIGLAIAEVFVKAGADVVISARSADACATAAREIGASPHACDVTDSDALDALFARFEPEGGFDVLVCCAGASSSASASKTSQADIQRMLDIHLHGSVGCAQRAARQMKAGDGGAILFVTSVWGLRGQPGTLAYGTAKAAMAQAVRVLAIEWARDGIRVNGLAPGFVDTEMTSGLDEAIKEKLLRRVPLRRAARPSEMAGPALMLCSQLGSYVTGQVLVADGGEAARV